MASDEDIQKELDVHIQRLELELCELKQRRNTLSPISRIPAEILCRIFLLTVEDYYDRSQRRLPLATPFSHVSHTWRRVAIGCQELWGIIRVGLRTKGEMLRVAAARAQQAPITLNMRCFARDATPTVPSGEAISALSMIVREGAERCSAFDLYAREDSLQSLLSGFSPNFDSLTTLTLDIVGIEDRTAPLTELLKCTFPRLRILTVQRPSIPIDCTLLQSPRLTHVHIDHFIYTTTLISDILTLLERLDDLRSFIFAIPFRDLDVPSVKAGCPIYAPKLELLDFSSRLDNAVHLLSSISFPSRLRLGLYAETPGESLHVVSSIAQAYGHVAPIALQLEADSLKAWDISSVDAHTGRVNTDTTTPWIFHRDYGHTTRMSLWEYAGWSFMNLRVLIVAYVVEHFREIPTDIDTKNADTAKFWTFLAASASALEVIDITNYDTGNSVTLMNCLRGTRSGEENPTPPWPALQSLRLSLPNQYRTNEYKRRRKDDPMPSLHHQLEYALDLVDVLRVRVINGSKFELKPLTSLEFNTPFAEPVEDDVSLILRTGAAKVTWRFYPRTTQP